ncbi:MAG: ATP-dependent RecD-like DNA helicase [Clostridia bacterium]|nr:ATP-dependent RecD-like DNA helicase [Clostridia bacterium]
MDIFDNEVLKVNEVICNNIAKKEALGEGLLSQNIISHLRNFVEAIALKIYSTVCETSVTEEEMKKALKYMRANYKYDFLRRFHKCLQVTGSHTTADADASVRLMWKYVDFMYECKSLLKTEFGLEVLHNLEDIQLQQDETLFLYYREIAKVIERVPTVEITESPTDRYYVNKKKPLLINGERYYEMTLSPADDKISKNDRIIAFTKLDVPDYYAVHFRFVQSCISVINRTMTINIAAGFRVSVRPCEFDNYFKLLGYRTNIATNNAEYRGLMGYLTDTGINLTEFLECGEAAFDKLRGEICKGLRATPIFSGLKRCREFSGKSGYKVLKYLLYRLNNQVTKDQYYFQQNEVLSNLHIKYGCIPFDRMPFAFNLTQHPSLTGDLFECFNAKGREHELLARKIKNNTEINAKLYTSVSELTRFKNIEELVQKFNSLLYYKHVPGSCLEIYNGFVYIHDYEKNTIDIINKLSELSKGGIENYKESVENWLSRGAYKIDSAEKLEALKTLFVSTRVSLIYGSAGTGKSTMINHISHFFEASSRLYLSNTHAAVENLKRNVIGDPDKFRTVRSCLREKNVECDILFIDECSTVSNQDMIEILKTVKFKLLVLVGDIYQIESIKFGNWFSIARYYIPKNAVYELSYVHRSTDDRLKEFWNTVRSLDERMMDRLENNGYSSVMAESIFEKQEEDEIVLCLNYDGLYGINNINRFLQDNNDGKTVTFGLERYKTGDPIIFKENERFDGLLYNNLKGTIVGIEEADDYVTFTTEVDKVLNAFNIEDYPVDLKPTIHSGKSVISFRVGKFVNADDEDRSAGDIVPFRVAYAISIHKAQGLEYDSVKVVITDEAEELITHNIFYTAITRAKKRLKIYWSTQAEKNILKSMHLMYNKEDAKILAEKYKLKLSK